MSGPSGCLRSDRVYSARRLRLRDNLRLPAKARARGAGAAVGLRSTHMVAGDDESARAHGEHLM